MRARIFTVTLIAIPAVACVATLLAAAQRDGGRAIDSEGRYHGAVEGGQVFLFDTKTGECWRALPFADQAGWKRIVKPLSSDAERAD